MGRAPAPREKAECAHVCARVHRDAAWPWGSGRTPLFVPRRDPAPRAGCARVTLHPSPQDTTVVFSQSHPTARLRGLLCTLQRFQVCFPALANHFPSSGTSESQRAPGALPQGRQLGSGMQGWGLLMPSRRELEPLSRASVWPRRIDPNWLFFPWFHLNTITSLSHHYLAAPLGNTFFRSPCLPNCPNIIFFKEVRTCSGTRRAWGTHSRSFRRPGRS